MPPLIEVTALARRFGLIRAVDDISFSIGRGEVLGFLGPNGAGKSTTMRMLSGFLTPTSGTVRIGGLDIVEYPLETKGMIGYLPEGAPLYGDMTTQAFIEFAAAARGLRGSALRRSVTQVIDRLELGQVARQRIDTLSKGFKRRVGIAQAIVHDPQILILDEPTDGLDPNQKHAMRALIREMAPEKAIIVSTHMLEEVDAICTRAIIIDRGRFRLDATPDTLRRQSIYHNAVRVTLREPAARSLEDCLKSSGIVRSISRVSVGTDTVELLIAPDGDRSLLTEVQAMLARETIVADTITIETGRLDEVFRALTTPGLDAAA